jgi:type II secretory pathway pseudopilin PulG
VIRRRHSERGFMLLFVLLVAAGIAISMYMELPRIAFETQRNREELLMERGKQYQRAIGLYLKKFNRYPAKMEDLENTNNLRFLRRRYVDPMTGKDDWRIVHAGPGGMLTDSLVKRTPAAAIGTGTSAGMGPGIQQNAAMNAGGSLNANPGFSDPNNNNTDPNQPQQVNPAAMRRASDRSLAGNTAGAPPSQAPDPNLQTASGSQPGQFVATMPGEQTQPGQQQNGQPGQPPLNQPQAVTGEQPQVAGQPQAPVPGQPLPPGYPQRPGLPPGIAGLRPGFPGQPFQPPANMQAGFSPQPQPTDQPQPGQPQPQAPQSAFNNNGPGNAGLQAVQNQLTGQAGLSGGGNSAFNNNSIGGGIAGVASKYKGPSIKVYDEQQRYEKWEFIYDPKKDTALNKGLPAQQAVTNPGNTLGQSSGSTFNNNSSTFNNGGGAQPPPAPPPPAPPQQ